MVPFSRDSTRSHVIPANTVVAKRGRHEVRYLTPVQYSMIEIGYHGIVVNPDRCQLIREYIFFLSPFAPANMISRGRFGHPIPRQPVHSPHTG